MSNCGRVRNHTVLTTALDLRKYGKGVGLPKPFLKISKNGNAECWSAQERESWWVRRVAY